jgi:creatinine amidohydrolase
MLDFAQFIQLDPVKKKELLGDGNYGGLYQRSDEEMLAMWRVAVEETRALMQEDWA